MNDLTIINPMQNLGSMFMARISFHTSPQKTSVYHRTAILTTLSGARDQGGSQGEGFPREYIIYFLTQCRPATQHLACVVQTYV